MAPGVASTVYVHMRSQLCEALAGRGRAAPLAGEDRESDRGFGSDMCPQIGIGHGPCVFMIVLEVWAMIL